MIAGIIFLALLGFFFWYILRSKKRIRESYSKNLTIDDEYNARKVSKQEELDRILDKISQSGYKSLNRSEKDFLKNFD